MSALPAGVTDVPVALVSDGEYLPALLGLIAHARARIDCSLFMVDLAPGPDGRLAADDVLHALAAAAWRGVRVRLLLGAAARTWRSCRPPPPPGCAPARWGWTCGCWPRGRGAAATSSW